MQEEINLANIFDRTVRLIGDEAQRKVGNLAVGVAGCGVLGHLLVVVLSRMGVAEIRVLDYDVVEAENLANSLLLDKADLGFRKVEAATSLAKEFSLKKTKTKVYHLDVTDPHKFNSLLEFLDGLDVVYGCFDNIPARLALNSAALIKKVPYVDLGIEGFAGRIRMIDSQRACYACNTLVSKAQEISIFKLTKNGKGCDYASTVTILPVTLAISAHAINESLKYLGIIGERPWYDYMYFEFLSPSNPVKMKITKRRKCEICSRNGFVKWYEEWLNCHPKA